MNLGREEIPCGKISILILTPPRNIIFVKIAQDFLAYWGKQVFETVLMVENMGILFPTVFFVVPPNAIARSSFKYICLLKKVNMFYIFLLAVICFHIIIKID